MRVNSDEMMKWFKAAFFFLSIVYCISCFLKAVGPQAEPWRGRAQGGPFCDSVLAT